MLDWMNHKQESRWPGEISTTLDMQIWQKAKRMKVKEESEKTDLKLNIQKN